MDDTIDDVKEVPPIQRGVSSVISKLGSRSDRGNWSGKDYDPPVKSVEEGHRLPSSGTCASKDVAAGPSDKLLTHRAPQS